MRPNVICTAKCNLPAGEDSESKEFILLHSATRRSGQIVKVELARSNWQDQEGWQTSLA